MVLCCAYVLTVCTWLACVLVDTHLDIRRLPGVGTCELPRAGLAGDHNTSSVKIGTCLYMSPSAPVEWHH